MKRVLATILMLCVLCCALTSCHKTRFVVKGLTDEYGNTYDAVGYRNEHGTDCYLGHLYYSVSSDINNFKIVIPESLRDSSNGKDYPVVALQGPNRANGPIEGVYISIDLQNEQIINTPMIIEVITNLDDIAVSGGSTLTLSDVNGNLIENVDLLFVKPGTNHEHTYELIYWDLYHYRSYTCGCKTPDNFAKHSDGNDDRACDECGYTMSDMSDE